MALEQADLEQIKQIIADTVKAVFNTPLPKAEKPKKSRKKPRPAIDKSTKDVIIEAPKTKQPVRIRPANVVTNKRGQGQPASGRHICRQEPTSFGPRPNKFLESQEASLHKNDSEMDKKLWANKQPTLRREPVEMWEVQCRVCNKICVVSPTMLLADADTGDVSYTCDNCIRR